MKNKFYILLVGIFLMMGCEISKTKPYMHGNYYFKYIDKQSVCFCGFTYNALDNLDGDTLYIPSKIYGLNVTKVECLGHNGSSKILFYGYYEAVKKVVIPSTVEVIGSYAFGGCSSLKKITLPSSLKEIGYCAFSGCSSLRSVTFKDTSNWYIQYGKGAWNIIDVSDSTNNANILKVEFNYDGYRLEKRY